MNGRELVAWNVKRIRVEKGVSQERLAYDSRVDRSYLGGLERAEANPTVDLLQRLAASLNVPLADFFAEPEQDAQAPASLKAGRRPK